VTDRGRYLLDNKQAEAGQRFDALSALFNPSTFRHLERATVEQIRGGLVASGLATDAEIDQHLANVAAGQLDLATSPMVSAWGQRRELRRRDTP
jgi:hypothetical protein